MSTMSVAKDLSANTARNDLAGGIVAGFSAGVVQSLLTALFRDVSLGAGVGSIFAGVAAYFLVGVLLQHYWRNRLVPNWLLTSLVGSIVFVAAWLTPAVINGWYDLYNAHRSLTDYLLPELEAAGTAVFLFHLVTLPITAVFHYAREIVAAAETVRTISSSLDSLGNGLYSVPQTIWGDSSDGKSPDKFDAGHARAPDSQNPVTRVDARLWHRTTYPPVSR